jgi:hypothetical protein
MLHPNSQKPLKPVGMNNTLPYSGKSTPIPLDIFPRNGKIWKYYGVIGNYLVASTKS